ncbi:predicted protein [Naegleria gruberi]|uniref:Predicted protein n=1 Tax=Naegleria gruberi TaxID=5762 RepID=D2VDE1_NAEGR|nr:uncharacterized protein NAEGRDRAFT_48589 [Naegleria gruberi]EFC45128.1 predicted protein [Naegleria gruberi]|eukprot:XP_002677872.1 predicted protein [Naegleria gruberi strain NEG-M]
MQPDDRFTSSLSLSHSLPNPNQSNNNNNINNNNQGSNRANNKTTRVGGHQQQSSGFYPQQQQQQQHFNNLFPQQTQQMMIQEHHQQHSLRQSPVPPSSTMQQHPATMYNYNSSSPMNSPMNNNNMNNMNNTPNHHSRFNTSSQVTSTSVHQSSMHYNTNNNIGNNYAINSSTSAPFNNSTNTTNTTTTNQFSSGNNTFSDFYSAKAQQSNSKPGELGQNTNMLLTNSGSVHTNTNYQNVYKNDHLLTTSQLIPNTNNMPNQTYNDFNITTNQLQSSSPSIHSPNFHSSSSSDKNSNTVIELPKPKKKTKSKPPAGVGQLSFTIPPIASEERFDDVSEAVAFSGTKLFPIACVACCSSKGIECQYRTPRKKGRALQSNDGFQTFTSLDEIKYIPQSQGFTDTETVMNATMPSNSLSVSPPKDLGIDDIVTKKRKKSQKKEESVPKKLAVDRLPTLKNVETSPNIQIVNVNTNNDYQQPTLVQRNQTPSPKQDISNRIQIPSISPSELYDSPQTQLSTVTPSNNYLAIQSNTNNFPLLASNVVQPDLAPFNDPNATVDTISQLLVLLLSSNNQSNVASLIKDILNNGDGEGLKKLLGTTFGLESFITTNERLNISAIKKRTVDLYDEIISFGYPILSSQYIDEALSATNIRAYSNENLALIYAIHAVTCQRLCELEQAKQAYHKSLMELKETTDKHNLIVIATYCNLALYCGGTGDTDTAQQLLASAEIYLLNRRKFKLQTNDTNLVLNFIGCDDSTSSFTLFDNLSNDEFKVEKLKEVCSVAAYLGSGSSKPSIYMILRGYSFAEEIGVFLSECLLLFEGKITKKDLNILTKPIDANTFSDYLGVLSRVESAYSGHESARPYSSLQMKLAASLLLCVLGGSRAWVLHRAGIKGPIIEEYASQVTSLTTTEGFLLLHSLTIQFVAKALEIHYETVCDAESGLRKNNDLLELYQTMFTCFNSLVELSKRFTRILRFYPNLLHITAIKLMSRGFTGESIDLVIKNMHPQTSPHFRSDNNLQNPQTAGDHTAVGNEVKFNFDQLLSNFIATTMKSPFN